MTDPGTAAGNGGRPIDAVYDRVAGLVQDRDWPEMAERLAARRRLLDQRATRVLVMGDFKSGKSSLVNALVGDRICPVDVSGTTTLPTALNYGPDIKVTVYRDPESDGSAPAAEAITVDDLPRYVFDSGDPPAEAERLRSCVVSMPSPALEAGLEIVDMPGVGGLESAAGRMSAAELVTAAAALFVVDASQELTRPELDLLRAAVQTAPDTVLILSKIDYYPEWRRMVELNNRHLASASIELPVYPVSTSLYDAAVRLDVPELAEESGINEIRSYLTAAVGKGVEKRLEARLAVDLADAIRRLRSVAVAEMEASEPGRAESVIADLEDARDRVQRLRGDTADWKRALRDDVEDLGRELRDELERLRADVGAAADDLIDQSDPERSWEQLSSWLGTEAGGIVTAMFDFLGERAIWISNDVASRLAEAESGMEGVAGERVDFTADVKLKASEVRATEGRGMVALTSTWAVGDPIVAISQMVPALNIIGLCIAAVGAVIFGRRAVRKHRDRQLTERQRQAKDRVGEYLKDVERLVWKDIDKAASHLFRQLRDGALMRIDEMERSVTDALGEARLAAAGERGDQEFRAAELRQEIAAIDELDRQVAAIGNGHRG